jgi:hypothetical protein
MHACVDIHANKSLVTLFILFACAGTAEDTQVKRLWPERPVFDYRKELYVSRRHENKTGFVAHADFVLHKSSLHSNVQKLQLETNQRPQRVTIKQSILVKVRVKFTLEQATKAQRV